jgi:dihydrofolate reductase
MRSLIMWNLVTLDGLFEGGKSWDLGWHEYVWGEELERFSIEQLKTADMLVFGRTTYQGMAAYWATEKGEVAELMNAIPKLVFSRTLESADWSNTRLVKTDAGEELLRLKEQGGRNMFIFGSAELSATLSAHALIDEYRLCLVPLVLGSGKPLFKGGAERMMMRLIESRQLGSGGLLLFYRPTR